MKRIVVVACILYTANSYTMQKVAVCTFGASPVVLSGGYYCYKAYRNKEELEHDIKKELTDVPHDIKRGLMSIHRLRHYIDGVLQGMAPGSNMKKIVDGYPVIGRSIEKMQRDERVGFFSGLLLYATIPAARLLWKLK